MRLFIEAVLGISALDRVWQAGDRLRDDASFPDHAVRWVKREAIHATIRFLGEVESERVGDVVGAMSRLEGSGQFTLHFDRIGVFGGRRPRVIWVGVADDDGLGRLNELRRQLDETLEPEGFVAEGGSFRPHLTLGRVRRQATRTELAAIHRGVAEAPPLSIESDVARVALIESTLLTDGPRYRRLAVTEL